MRGEPLKLKQKVKIAIDLLMTILLVVLMAYPVTGQLAHEWAGAGMFLLFIAHHILNRHWFKTLGRGKYNGLRAVQTAVDILLLADMLALMFSGIRLSRYVFSFLPVLGSAATARRLHMLASYWGLVLMGLHLGLHWGMMAALFRRRLGGKTKMLFRCAGTAAGLYGVYAVWRHQIWLYLSLRSEFLLLDFEEPAALYFLDHFCILALFVLLSHGAVSLWRNHRKGAAET